MPLYEYEALGKTCPLCANGFEVLQAMDDPPLERCPECGQPCRRIISAPRAHSRASDPLSPANLAAKGFTQYRKETPGVYRKTAGQGPDYIKR
ncbi:MAG: zinc ribbon domain-containing protein [Deltaproteobacteria bacterium]|nr:zinc ribbon domain-containing protein [Deltaproteobacteria bacterium]